MAFSQKTPCIVASLLIFLLTFPSWSMSEPQPSIRISVNDSVLEVEAREVALEELLTAISEKTGIHIKLGEPLTETVSVTLEAMPAEKAFKRLLAGRSYKLSYKRAADGRFIPDELRVLGKRPTDSSLPLSYPEMDQDAIFPNSHVKKVERDQFIQQFADTDSLMKQIAAVPVADGAFTKGIRITDLVKDSALVGIGLSPGDIIADINGSPVTSAQQFLESLKSSPEERSLVMIQRQRNGNLDSIYIHLR